MSTLFLDLETVPTTRPDFLERIRAAAQRELAERSERIAAEFKKAETIETKLRELREGAAARHEAMIRATALDGSVGEIIAIGFALDDDPVEVLARVPEEPEAELLREFFRRLPAPTVAAPVITGHNIEFDVRFLFQRCVVLGVNPPIPLAPEKVRTFCTMQAWAGRWNRDRWPSLDELCLALGIASPKASGVDGSKVFDLVKSGDFATLRAYCTADVEAVREVQRRLTFGGTL